MALTLNNHYGFDIGGLEECSAVSGASASSVQARSGAYSAKPASSGDYLEVSPFGIIPNAGNRQTVGYGLRTEGSANSTAAAVDDTGQCWKLTRNASGKTFSLYDANDTQLGSDSSATLADDTWGFVEVVWDYSEVGNISVYLDNTLILGPMFLQDLISGSVLTGYRFYNSAYYDDIYCMSGAVGANERLGDFRCKLFTSLRFSPTPQIAGVISGTADDLDGGDIAPHNWVDMSGVPLQGVNWAGYTGDSGGANSVDISGDITPDPVSAKFHAFMSRGLGGITTHYGVWGNSGDGASNTRNWSATTTATYYDDFTESSSVVPLASEDLYIGIEVDGDQDYNSGFAGVSLGYAPSGAVNYTLLAEGGALAITGSNAALGLDAKLATGSGAYEVTGSAANLEYDQVMPTEGGAYAISGQDANLARGLPLSVESGSYSIVGQGAALTPDRNLAAESGSYGVSGADVALAVTGDFPLVAGSGDYAVTGSEVSLTRDFIFSPDAGSYLVTGPDAGLVAGSLLRADAGAYALSGGSAALSKGWKLIAYPGSYSVQGSDALLVVSGDSVVVADSGAYVLAGPPVGVFYSRALEAEGGAYLVSGLPVTLTADYILSADTGVYNVVGYAVGIITEDSGVLCGPYKVDYVCVSYGISAMKLPTICD